MLLALQPFSLAFVEKLLPFLNACFFRTSLLSAAQPLLYFNKLRSGIINLIFKLSILVRLFDMFCYGTR